MDNEKVFKLIDAGFTAEEIRKMGFQTEGTESEGSVSSEQSTEPAAHEGEVVNPTASDEIRELKASILELNGTVKALQEANIRKAESGSASVPDQIQDHINSFLKEF